MKSCRRFFITFLAVFLGLFAHAFTGTQAFSAETAGRLDAVVAEYQLGNYEAVFKELGDLLEKKGEWKNIGEAEFLMGLTLYYSERPADAVPFFNACEKDLPTAQDLCALYRTRALEDSGKAAEALADLRKSRTRYRDSELFTDTGLREARLLGMSGEYESAGNALVAEAASREGERLYAQMLYEAGGYFDKASRTQKAMDVWQKGMELNGNDYFSGLCLRAHCALTMKRYDGRPPASYKAAVEKIADASEKRDADRVTQPAYECLQTISGKLGDEDTFKLGMSAFFNHDNEKAKEALSLVSVENDFDDACSATYRLGKLETRRGDNVRSREVFKDLLRRFPDCNNRKSALYQLALLDMEDGEYKKANQYFESRLRSPAGTQKEYLTWLLAWSAYRSGKLDAAEKTFGELLSRFKKTRHADRYTYWRAVIKKEKHNAAGAIKDWKMLADRPLSYYGMLSARRLKDNGIGHTEISDIIRSEAPASAPLPDPSWFPADLRRTIERVSLFAKFGCVVEAGKISESAFYRIDADEKSTARNLSFLLATGRYHTAMTHGSAKKASGDDSVEDDDWVPRNRWLFRYPPAYKAAVNRAAKNYRLDPALIYAIMFNESRMQPRVVSRANAQGLMQIVPRTAAKIAEALGDGAVGSDHLFDPEINIRYGAWYLRRLMDQFGDNLPCVIAAYNAGPDMVNKLKKAKSDLSDEIFIEEISYKETNDYIKKVIATMAVYRALLPAF